MVRLLIAALSLGSAVTAQENGAYAVIHGPNGTVKASLFSDQYASVPVATVDDQVVTLGEFSKALGEMHGAHKTGDKAGAKNFTPVLDRLIAGRLVSMEAREMGLDELPEVKKAIADFEQVLKRAVLEERVTTGVKADQSAADQYFRDLVREWKLRSALFAKQEDARASSVALKNGVPWEAATKKGEQTETDYVRAGKMRQQLLEAVEGVFAGQVTDPIQVDGGWALVKVLDVRYPQDPAAREKADARALDEARERALRSWYDQKVKETVTTNDKLLDKLDFEAKKPGFAALEKDKRAISRIQGGKTVTVADLAGELHRHFFHGVDEAIKVKSVNESKYKAFKALLAREVAYSEVKRLKIEQTPEYRKRLADYTESIFFGAFVQKAVLPGLKVTEEEGKAYYDKHQAEFTLPAFYKLESLSFYRPKHAQAAFDKLKAGTDFAWLKQNAEGQVPEDKRVLDFTGGTVSGNALNEDLAARLKGVKPGDFRLYDVESQHLVVRVIAVTPEQPQPYLQVRADIGKKLSAEKVNKAVDEWVQKLRKAHDVKVYLAQIGT